MANIISLKDTIPGKFQSLSADLDKISNLLPDLEAQFGQLGLVSRIEKLVERIVAKRLGWNIKIFPEISSKYVLKILVSTILPTLHLSRKFTTDLVKSLKASGSSSPVVNALRKEINSIVHSVRDGEEPFEESASKFKSYSYILVEASTAGGSFQAALPVGVLSLVDTDNADQAYVAQELKDKKDHFILKPTTEQIRDYLLDFCKSSPNLLEYIDIIKYGNIKILKEHITESNNRKCIISNRIVLSPIRSNNVLQ